MTTNTRDVVRYTFTGLSLKRMEGGQWVEADDYDAVVTSLDATIRQLGTLREAMVEGESRRLVWQMANGKLLAERDMLRAAMEKLRDACIESQDFIYAGIATGALAGATPQPAPALVKAHKGTSVVGYAKCNVPDCWCASE